MEITGAQDSANGQLFGIPGMWQGASLEQGISSEDGEDGMDDPAASGIAMDCIPPTLGMASAKPPAAIIRWSAKRLARSAAKRRERFMAYTIPISDRKFQGRSPDPPSSGCVLPASCAS
ncbi:MAG: hypothetical protein ACRD2Z_10875, partial [Thermoanaerobaculia bacterium]